MIVWKFQRTSSSLELLRAGCAWRGHGDKKGRAASWMDLNITKRDLDFRLKALCVCMCVLCAHARVNACVCVCDCKILSTKRILSKQILD